MTPENENFDQLRKLLALKKHEAPPPAYFDSLPGKIMARIEAAQGQQQLSWWRRWLARFEVNPIAAGAGIAVVGVCLLLLAVLTMNTGPVSTPSTAQKAPATGTSPVSPTPETMLASSNSSSAPTGLFNPGGQLESSSRVERVNFEPQPK